MTEQHFRGFLSRRAVNYRYSASGQEGIVSVWPYQDRYVLTWEECKAGDQYNEGNYTRDEVHNFADIDAVIGFLHGSGVEPTGFSL